MQLVIVNKDRKPVTTSLAIAETFEKRHDNLIRDIEDLQCSKEFNLLNFEEITYTDGRGRTQRAYEITRDGFVMLVMGFTGEKAMAFKEKYIAAFNDMAERVRLLSAKEQIQLDFARHQRASRHHAAAFFRRLCCENGVYLPNSTRLDTKRFKSLCHTLGISVGTGRAYLRLVKQMDSLFEVSSEQLKQIPNEHQAALREMALMFGRLFTEKR